MADGQPRLLLAPENLRPDPFGGIVAADRTTGAALLQSFTTRSARAAYVSCHLVASLPEGGSYRLSIRSPDSSLEPVLFREWFHLLPSGKQYIPDALVPAPTTVDAEIPNRENRIPGQTVDGFWLDVWVSPNARTGPHVLTATLTSGGREATAPIRIDVLAAVVPDQDAVTLDGNSYGTSWFAGQYPNLAKRLGTHFADSAEFFGLIQAYHRIFFEHRGTFHQLGYGHAGKVAPEFAPALAGSGAGKHITDWTLYDKQFAPLLDGSAFTHMRRPAKPISSVYLPINPEWPASFEWWGEPGYAGEFVNVVSGMEQHFREKGWTKTRFELFFNHKKRYKGFAWDGDEARFAKDYQYVSEYARLMRLAVPADSPVQFVFRSDVSWTMEQQWKELAGVINFWVCGEGMLSWYPQAPEILRKRGDIVWTYGGTPSLTEPSSHVTLNVLRPWIQHVEGFVRWQVTSPGTDPWFHSEGETEAMVYPGDRFGIEGPIPSIRLKLQRNAVQEITLLSSLERPSRSDRLRRSVVQAFNNTTLEDWWIKRPQLADGNPEDWSNADLEDATKWPAGFGASLDSAAFERVRTLTLDAASDDDHAK